MSNTAYVPAFPTDQELDALIASMLADVAPITKTDVMISIASKRGEPVVNFKAATLSADDMRGLPVVTIKPVRAPFFNVSWRKVGGLTFVRLGRLSLSFCLTRKAI